MPFQLEVSDLVTIAIADSTQIHTQLLTEALSRHSDLQVVVSASNSSDLFAAVARVPVDVAIISHTFEDQFARGTAVLRELRSLRPHIKGVILLDSARSEDVLDCFRSGAKGIFSKHERLENLRKCIRSVHVGQIWARSADLDLALEALAKSPVVRTANHKGLELLSTRERQVVEYLSSGRSNREIADALGLSRHTIKNYLFRIFDKLGVSSRTELLYLTMSGSVPPRAGVSPDCDDKAPSLHQAAEAGVASAQLQLADLCSRDNGDQDERVAAYMWYLLADRTTVSMREKIEGGKKRLSRILSPQQRAEAEDRAAKLSKTTRKDSAFAALDFSSEPRATGTE